MQVEELPSVTQIIRPWTKLAFDGIPVFNLERAAQRGTEVHTAAALHLAGLWEGETAGIEGYLRSLKDWVQTFVGKTILVEPSLEAPDYGFRGQPDAIVKIKGDSGFSLIDWKTPKPLSKSWRLQLAGYRLLVEVNGYKIVRVASLRLDTDGGPAKFEEYTKTLAHDQNVFLSALNVWKFFNLD